jgi:hypothetical protein
MGTKKWGSTVNGTPSTLAIRNPDIRVKYCAYGHSAATLLNPCGVTTVSHKYGLTAAKHATVIVTAPSTLYYQTNYEIKMYYLR